MFANAGLTALYEFVLMMGALGLAIFLLSVSLFALLFQRWRRNRPRPGPTRPGKRPDRRGSLRVLAVGVLLTGVLCVWLSDAPLFRIVALVLALAGVQLLRKSTAAAGANKSNEGTTDEQFWEQFDE